MVRQYSSIGRAALTTLALACSGEPIGDVQVSLDQFEVGGHTVAAYVHFVPDGAALGFSLPGPSGAPRYYPLYLSTSRSLPAGEIGVLVSPTDDSVWFTSTWPGYELLGYHRFGDDYSISRYGRVPGGASPAPMSLDGDLAPIPLPVEGARLLATLILPTAPPP